VHYALFRVRLIVYVWCQAQVAKYPAILFGESGCISIIWWILDACSWIHCCQMLPCDKLEVKYYAATYKICAASNPLFAGDLHSIDKLRTPWLAVNFRCYCIGLFLMQSVNENGKKAQRRSSRIQNFPGKRKKFICRTSITVRDCSPGSLVNK